MLSLFLLGKMSGDFFGSGDLAGLKLKYIGRRAFMENYINRPIACNCGREHSFPIQGIWISGRALDKLPEQLAASGYRHPLFIYDRHTYRAAAPMIGAMPGMDAIPRCVLRAEEPAADEAALCEILIACEPNVDLLIGVGSGTINDLCRFVSHRARIDYYIVATAPSMDGYASDNSPLIVRGMKITYPAHTPQAIFADTRLLATSCADMRAAGVGDLLGKHISLCEWKLSHLVNGEYYCPFIADMVAGSIPAEPTGSTDSGAALESGMRGLCVSGIGMKFAGNSRPASGSEHHLSHYWEMRFLFAGRGPVLHGIKVGVATHMVLKMLERLRGMDVDFGRAKAAAENYAQVAWEARMRDLYGPAAADVVRLERETGKNSPAAVRGRLERYEALWPRMMDAFASLPPSAEIERRLSAAGAPVSPREIGVSRQLFIDGVAAAKELRNRWGLLQILFDLQLSEELASAVYGA